MELDFCSFFHKSPLSLFASDHDIWIIYFPLSVFISPSFAVNINGALSACSKFNKWLKLQTGFVLFPQTAGQYYGDYDRVCKISLFLEGSWEGSWEEWGIN